MIRRLDFREDYYCGGGGGKKNEKQRAQTTTNSTIGLDGPKAEADFELHTYSPTICEPGRRHCHARDQ